MTPHYADDLVTLYHGDCLDVLRELPDASVDAVVTDPPYGLEFMGKDWDSFWDGRRQAQDGWEEAAAARSGKGGGGPSYRSQHKGAKRCTLCGKRAFSGSPCECSEPVWVIEHRQEAPSAMVAFQSWCTEWTRECYRVLKPGGHLLAFGGTRTFHRLACATEDAGFEIRDSIAWLYGSGFSKGGLLGNRASISWCECGENAVPYSHARNPDVLRMRGDVHETPVPRGEGENTGLLASMQRGEPGQGVGEARPQGAGGVVASGGSVGAGEDDRRAEPGVDRGGLHRAGEGLPHDPASGSPARQGERIRGRAPAGDGVVDRAASDAARGSASHQPGPGGQPSGKPSSLPGPHKPLDDRTHRGRGGCPRCGGTPQAFRGFSTTLKPAFEPVVCARKPLVGTVAANVLTHGTGALNVEACRINPGEAVPGGGGLKGGAASRHEGWQRPSHLTGEATQAHDTGRWPANVVLDESQADALDQMSGEGVSKSGGRTTNALGAMNDDGWQAQNLPRTGHDDSGGASRFFYTAKADAAERVRINGTAHPTVKPLALMRWLVRLVTPPGGTVLEPFAGSGTTVEACILEGFRCIAIEREADYLPLIRQRIDRRIDPVAAVKASGGDGGLFDLLDGGDVA